MQPLYLARIEDLGHGDLVKVDCAACHHVALLTPEFPVAARAEPSSQGGLPKDAASMPRMRSEGTSRRLDQVGAPGPMSRGSPNGHGAREGAAPEFGDPLQRRPYARGLDRDGSSQA
jgi:hypothetical protein